MRVLLVADVVGGVDTFVRELSREFVRRGIELHLALIGRQERRAFAGLDAASCQVRDLRLEWMDDPWSDVEETSAWVEDLRARHDPDVVHMNTFAPLAPGGSPVLLSVHSCVLTWWRAVQGVAAPPEWNRYARLVRRALSRADLLIVPTQAFGRQLEDTYGRLASMRVIPNGRSVEVVPTFRERDPVVVTVGRLWDEAKNAALLVRAAPNIDGRVVAIGPGEVAPPVEGTGPLPEHEVHDWLSRAAVFAEPARYEPFGLAVLEAALCGCALVLGDIPSLRELWEGAAQFVSPDDPDDLAQTINRLLAAPQRRVAAAVAAHAAALHYAPATMAGAYLGAYEELVQRDRFVFTLNEKPSRSEVQG